MKSLVVLLSLLFIFTSCTDRVVYVERGSAPVEYAEQAPEQFYSNCWTPNGYRSDSGRYYPNGWTYYCNGVPYRSGIRHRGLLTGSFLVGAYYMSGRPGYGHYGRSYSNITYVNNNVTIVKRGSSGYKKRMGRFNKIQKTRNKNSWVSKKEKKRRSLQSKRAKKRNKKSMRAKAKGKKKSGLFGRKKTQKSGSWGKTRKKKSSWGSSSRKKKSWGSSSRRRGRSGRSRKSDVRLKTNIEPIKNALYKVYAMRGVTYHYKSRLMLTGKQIGFIAQELEEIVPEVVHTDKKGYKSVDYDVLVALLVEAMREQNNLFEDRMMLHDKRIEALEKAKK